MLRSLIQLDFIHAGGTLRLLSAGDGCDKEPSPAANQAAEQWSEDGGAWGGTTALGGASVAVAFSARKYHASHAAAREYCLLAAGMFLSGVTGTLRWTITGAATWEMPDAVLTATAPAPLVESGRFATLQSFSITGGPPAPTSAITLFVGIPWDYILQEWDDLDGDWDDF